MEEDWVTSKWARSQPNHNISKVVSASAQYLASVLEQAVEVFFLLRQEIRESPRKIQKISGGAMINRITLESRYD